MKARAKGRRGWRAVFVLRGLVEGLWTIEARAESEGRIVRGTERAATGEFAELELRVR